MNAAQQFRFAMRQLAREWRAGELRVLLFALVIAISGHTAINHFTARLSSAMTAGANDVLGGDLLLSGGREAAPEWLARAEQLGLRRAHAVHFSSVLNVGEEILLVSVKAVDDAYPLKGKLKTAPELFAPARAVNGGPARGEAWVEPRVLLALQLAAGDQFELGRKNLTASRVLAFEPDRGNNLYAFRPRVLISQNDLAETGILAPGSRVWHRHMFAGPPDAIAQYREWLQPRLPPGRELRALDEERPEVAEALNKAKQYMGLASLVALLLAAVAIAGAGRQYSERHYDTSALLRCMGCKQRDILRIYLLQLLALAFAGGLLGNAVGYAAQAGLLQLLADFLPANLAPPGWGAVLSGMALAVVVLLGFTLPSVLRLKSVPPQRILRSDLAPLPASAWLVFGGAAALVTAMMWFYTGSFTLTAALAAGACAALLAGGALLFALFKAFELALPGLPLKIRAGLRNLLRRRNAAAAQTMAFGLTIMAMLVVVFIRTELIDTWRGALPEDAPNHFVLNIQKDERAAYRAHLAADGIDAGRLYPIVRGRLTRLNGKPIMEHVSKEEHHEDSLHRDLNLTWSDEVPPDNEILSGRWWRDGDETEKLVSVESHVARDLNIALGDRISLFTGELEWQARVASIRSVKWDNFKPNFYLIFNPGALDDLPVSWINSFHLPESGKGKLSALVKSFPSITLLEVDAILSQVERIIAQVTLALEAILGFVLAAGFTVTLAALRASMHERMREGALLRTLGAGRGLLRGGQWSEFAGIGLLAGLLGLLGAEVVNAFVYERVFELDYAPVWWAWLLVPPLSGMCIGWVGVANSRAVLRQSPAASLRRW
ncbi:MAG: ABC transporter permease [Arenicellales bacterium IbO2]|nr:FtsX-like permease family protein [Gammaproteobacteria bacterium]CAJ2376779.1 MAG: ABC transporter permease [Arenicellales bacterium IbO2]